MTKHIFVTFTEDEAGAVISGLLALQTNLDDEGSASDGELKRAATRALGKTKNAARSKS